MIGPAAGVRYQGIEKLRQSLDSCIIKVQSVSEQPQIKSGRFGQIVEPDPIPDVGLHSLSRGLSLSVPLGVYALPPDLQMRQAEEQYANSARIQGLAQANQRRHVVHGIALLRLCFVHLDKAFRAMSRIVGILSKISGP